jgi:hypothetical protein
MSFTFSSDTISIIKNFAAINPSLLFPKGNQLRTGTQGRNIIVDATIQETIPREFAIHDLNKLLGVLSSFNNPTIECQDKCLLVSSGAQQVRIMYCDPSLIEPKLPAKTFKMPPPYFSFALEESEFDSIRKTSSILKAPMIEITFSTEHDEPVPVISSRVDSDNPSGDLFTIVPKHFTVEDEHLRSCRFTFQLEYLKLLNGSYNVSLAAKNGPENTKMFFGRFAHTTLPVTYYIGNHPEYTKVDVAQSAEVEV